MIKQFIIQYKKSLKTQIKALQGDMKNIVCKNDINNMRIITNIHYIQYAHDKKIKQNEKKY